MTGLQMYRERGLYCAVFRKLSTALVCLETLGNCLTLHLGVKHELEAMTPVLTVVSRLLARLQTMLARTGLTIFAKVLEGDILALAAPMPDPYVLCEWQSEPELRCQMDKAVPAVGGLHFGWR